VLKGMRLLIVDDLAFNVALMRGLLREAGYTNIRSTRDALSVPELCESFEPDLVLLDFHMPGASAIDEIDLMLRVRTHLLTRHLQREAEHRGDVLDEAVRARTVELEQARLESLTILASVRSTTTTTPTGTPGGSVPPRRSWPGGSGCPSRSSPACAPPLRCTTSARSGSRTRSCSSRVR
jgi:CheY-like chemotaxis protein